MQNICRKALVSNYYIKNQQDATLAVLLISNCKITQHVSDASFVHHSGVLKTSNSHWCMSWVGMMYIQLLQFLALLMMDAGSVRNM